MRRKAVLLVVAVMIAAVGAFMVLMYVNGLSNEAAAQDDSVEVLTATELIDAGDTAASAQADGKLVIASVAKSDLLEGALTSVDSLDGEVALTPIYPGEQILGSKFGTTAASLQTLSIPDGMLAVSVQLTDSARVAGFVTPGSRVAIFESSVGDASADGTPNYTRVLVPEVTVIGVGQSTVTSPAKDEAEAEDADEEAVPKTILTLALDQEDSTRVIYAASRGALTFALLGDGTKVASVEEVSTLDAP